MKLLHVYAGNLYGGVETLLVTLAKERGLCPQMHPHFSLCFEGRLANELQAIGACVHLLGNVRVSRPWTVWKARRQLDRLLRQEQFDVVICHACWPLAIFGPVVKQHHLPLIFWCHDVPNGNHWIEKWAKLTPPNLVIANSQYTQSNLPKLYPNTLSNTLYLPVRCADTSVRHSLASRTSIRNSIRSQLNTPDDAIVIVQASRLERWKGQTVLLSALGKLQDVPRWVCWIAGGVQRPQEVEYLQELKAQAQELGIAERIQFLGHRGDVPHLLVAADIHCQPNTNPEPFGVAFIEALYAGLPIVTTAIGGGKEIVDESCGRLVEPNDVDALSQVLQLLITNPDQRSALAAKSSVRADQLCNPTRQIYGLYEHLSQIVTLEVN